MKVERTNLPSVHAYQQQANQTQEVKRAPAKRDQLQISDEAKSLLNDLPKVDPSRQEKVDNLKQEIMGGSYKVDAAKIAEKMYDFWFQPHLLNQKR